jgi:hypothetical protein
VVVFPPLHTVNRTGLIQALFSVYAYLGEGGKESMLRGRGSLGLGMEFVQSSGKQADKGSWFKQKMAKGQEQEVSEVDQKGERETKLLGR